MRTLHGLLPVLFLPVVAAAAPSSLEPLLAEASRGDHETVRRAHPASALEDGRLRVLVRLRPDAPAAALSGFECEAAAGPVVPVRLAPGRLAELSRRPGVLLVEACRTLQRQLDRSVPEIGAIDARTGLGLDGRDVIIGIIDTGIDFRHEDFIDAQGRTRLLHVLDFALADDAGSNEQGIAAHGARLYTAQDLERQLAMERSLGAAAPQTVLHRDTFGHGTHVAGIAAGTGAAAGPGKPRFRYVGVAPAASLIAVKAARGDGINFDDADVIHGLQFVFERAEALGLPAVANISLGTQLGPHDGTSNLATAISALTGPDRPGRIIVSAVGNSGGMDLHAAGWPAADGPSEVVLEIPPYLPGPGREIVHLEVWYDAGELSIELTSPGGRSHGPIPTGGRREDLTPEGLVKLLNAPDGPYPGNGRNKAVVIIDERDQVHPRSGRWVLRLDGQVPRYDVWLVNPGIRGDGGLPRLLGPIEPDTKIASPGTAGGVIAVGAYSIRSVWASQEGTIGVAAVQPGEHAYFSATGPTLDGRLVPDITAPGEFIVSALSRHAYPVGPASAFYVDEMPGALWHEDPVRGLLRGTSQAAPHVAGAVALLLQHRPDLTLPQVRELLRVGARVDEPVGRGQAWSPRWGFGKLDIAASLAVLDGPTPGAVDPLASGVSASRDLLPPGAPDHTVVTVIPRDSSGLPLGPGHAVTLSTTAGRLDAPVHVAYGRYEARFHPEGRLGDVAWISATVDGVTLAHQPRIHLATRRARIGPALEAGGGCQLAAGEVPASAPLALLLLFVVAVGRRRGPAQRRRSRASPSRVSPTSSPSLPGPVARRHPPTS